MRIALLTKRFPPACCGVGDYTAGLARAMSARGVTPVVLTGTEAAVEPPGVQVATVPLRGWRDLRGLLRRIDAENVEAVQLEYSGYGWGRHGFAFWVNAMIIALRWRGVPVTVALHEFQLRLAQHPLQAPIIALQLMHILLLAACASEVVTNTHPRVKMLRRLLFWRPARIQYRPNSSTIPVIGLDAGKRQALRAQRGAGVDTTVVTSFGMFAAGKNYEALIRAAADARRRAPLKLWLLGNWQAARPEYIASLRALIQELEIEADVFWSGFLCPEEASAHLQASDIFVLPQPDGHLTRSSAFMAAAAHGLPVIAVCSPPNQTEFVHGQSVWLVERSEPTTLAAALVELIQGKDLRARLGQNLSCLYKETFAWEKAGLPGEPSAPAVRPVVQPLRGDEQINRL